MYNPVVKKNMIISGTGKVVIVTGWSPKEAIANKLNPREYAAVGSLYSTGGVELILRNLLANPQATYLIALNATRLDANSRSVSVLKDFFKNGFKRGVNSRGQECWVTIPSMDNPTAYIDANIEEWALNLVRERVGFIEVTSLRQLLLQLEVALRQIREGTTDSNAKESPMEFPFSSQETLEFSPGDYTGHLIKADTVAKAWLRINHLIWKTGIVRESGHDSRWKELLNLMVVIRSESNEFDLPEYLPVSRELINEYIVQLLDDSLQGSYTYGNRLRAYFKRDQIDDVVSVLSKNINSSRAVMNLWDCTSDHESADPPCLNHIHVRVNNNRLNLTATFRSNDMFSAWPANAMQLSALQKCLVNRINQRTSDEYGLVKGDLTIVSQSAHLYEEAWASVKDTISRPDLAKLIRNELCGSYADPIGNFLIEVVKPESGMSHLLIKHTNPSGELIKEYRGRGVKALIQEIITDCPGIQPYHAAYLGSELTAAYGYLYGGRLQKEYVQDGTH